MRFIRADRSGAIVSRLLNWRQAPQIFAEFLWHFAHLTPGQRGHDTTVRPATAHEKGLAILNLLPWAPKRERPIFVLRVPEEDGRFREVIAWGAMAGADSLTGRATRAWPVYDLKLEKVVFLKDAWRSLMPGMEKESDILLQLNQAGVRNVPRLVCGDDIAGHLALMNSYLSLGTLEELRLHLGLSIVFSRISLGNICATLPHRNNSCKLFMMHLPVWTLSNLLITTA